MKVGPDVGDVAPDFTLPGVEGPGTPGPGTQGPGTQGPGTQGAGRRDYTLSDYRGKKVVLAFYPGDFTPGCTRQMCSYRDNFDDFEGADAVVLGISPQDVDSHERWIEAKQLPFPLLADTEHAVIAAYGVGMPILGVRRSVFLIDGAGIVRYKHVAIIGATFRKSGDLARELEAMA
jgi:peroxiredoxin Q/BCP